MTQLIKRKEDIKKNNHLEDQVIFTTQQDDRRCKSESHVLTIAQLSHINLLSLKVDTRHLLFGVDSLNHALKCLIMNHESLFHQPSMTRIRIV